MGIDFKKISYEKYAMKKTRKILFATDFSPSSNAAFKNLKRLTNYTELDIHFIHVLPSFWKNWVTSGLRQKEALQRLESWQEDILGAIDPSKLHVEIGNPANHILSVATKLDPEVIMMGGKNHDDKGRYKSGGTVENVVRHAKQSVLLSKPNQMAKIMCGIDGSEASGKALTWAIELAQTFQAALTLICVIPKAQAQALGMEQEELEQEARKKESLWEANIDDFLQQFDFTGIKMDRRIRWGRPSHVMLDMAEDFHYDIIIVGAKGHSMLEHVLMGSTSEKILRFTPCSLFVVR